MEELKPCPFCGGEAEEVHDVANRLFNPTAYYYIRCQSCGATGHPDLVPKHAEESWNLRTEPDNEPLTCEGCMYFDPVYDSAPCGDCKRLIHVNDFYKPIKNAASDCESDTAVSE